MQSGIYPRGLTDWLRCAAGWAVCVAAEMWGQGIPAASVPLLLPTAVVFDGAGNLYVAETNRHVVDRIDASGTLTVVAGNGTQGFAGDGGEATAAQMDSPQGVAVDGAGNLYIADTRNHRVRMVAAGTGMIATIAGTGVAGFSGDGGAGVRGQMNMPTALALDGAGNLDIADTNNHRVRQLALASGVLRTIVGNGVQGDAGDGGAALAASLDTPAGLAVDGAGNLYVADGHNHRVRRVASGTGVVTTVAGGGEAAISSGLAATAARLRLPRGVSVGADGTLYLADVQAHRILRVGSDGTIGVAVGDGTEGFAGDHGPGVAALLDGPRGAAVSAGGLVTVADTGNQRVRQMAGDGTLGPLGAVGGTMAQAGLTLAGPSVVPYGTGSVTATLAAGASGPVDFFEAGGGGLALLGSGALVGNAASFSVGRLGAGAHQIVARYRGDAGHASAQSAVLALTVVQAAVTAVPVGVAVRYGEAVPALAGTVAGVLAQDAGMVGAVFSSAAGSLSPVGRYAITVALTGAAAGNYRVAEVADATVTVGQAATATTLAASVSGASPAALGAAAGMTVTLAARVVSTTRGVPTGRVAFFDGGAAMGSSAVDASGAVTISATLGAGGHSVTAVYSGDGNFLTSVSAAVANLTVPGTDAGADFSLAGTGAGSQTVASGSAATYGFAVTVQNGTLNSPILLTASGMPVGAVASFSPTYLPPGGAISSFTLTVQTAKTAAQGVAGGRMVWVWVVAALALVGVGRRRVRWRGLAMVAALGVAGCGDRVTSLASAASGSAVSYAVTVTGTSTTAAGVALRHTAGVTLVVQ